MIFIFSSIVVSFICFRRIFS